MSGVSEDRKRNRRKGKLPSALWMAIVVGILLLIGIYMVYSASFVGVDSNPPWYYVSRHLASIMIGLAAGGMMFFLARMNPGTRFMIILGFFLFSGAALVVAYLFGDVLGGSKRWISVGFGFNLQPSELIKVSFILLMAGILAGVRPSSRKIPWILLAGIVAGAVVVENFSSGLLIFIPVVLMLMVVGMRFSDYLFLGIVGLAGAVGAIVTGPYRLTRILNFAGVWLNPMKADYQAKQSFYALADGGLLGVGLTNSKQKFFHLPEHHTDFIFAIVGEELGFFMALLLILLLFSLGYLVIQIALELKDPFARLAVFGYGTLILLQTLVNLAVVTGLGPVTGVTLPFISYGGSSMLSFLMMVGFILGAAIPRERKRAERKGR